MSEAPESESRPEEEAWLWPIVSGGFAISAVALWLSSTFDQLVQRVSDHWLAFYLFVALFIAVPLWLLAQSILARAVPGNAQDLPELNRWRKAWLVLTLACLVSDIVLGLLFLVAIPVDSAFAARAFDALVGVLAGSALVTLFAVTAFKLQDVSRRIRHWR